MQASSYHIVQTLDDVVEVHAVGFFWHFVRTQYGEEQKLNT